jgi:hypothetical protein
MTNQLKNITCTLEFEKITANTDMETGRSLADFVHVDFGKNSPILSLYFYSKWTNRKPWLHENEGGHENFRGLRTPQTYQIKQPAEQSKGTRYDRYSKATAVFLTAKPIISTTSSRKSCSLHSYPKSQNHNLTQNRTIT